MSAEKKETKVKVIKASKGLLDRKKEGERKLKVAAYCRVSTDDPEQEESFSNQVRYYTDLISENKAWENAGIYADKGITGTSDEKRPQFLKMIRDAMDGKIDIILVKSLSRFSRNVVDTLNYVRGLKEHNVSVRFEEEHIDTLTQDGELMLTVLSSVAQQEVQNTADHVKHGLQMKMSRGELVGYNGCLGYDYDPVTKTISVNKNEAKIVQYIFKRYLEGAGTTVLARELKQRHWKTKRGEEVWHDSTILGIIKNEKYKGDLRSGKTFTVDPISKRRLKNLGESDSYYVTNHHEAIVSENDWEKANEILKSRSYSRKIDSNGQRVRVSRKYVFSSILQCGFCGQTLSRRHWRSGANYEREIWQCISYSKHGKDTCEYCKGIPEETIKSAFVKAYNKVAGGKESLISKFLELSRKANASGEIQSKLDSNAKEMEKNKEKQARLANLYVSGTIQDEAYREQYDELTKEEEAIKKQREELEYMAKTEGDSLKAIEAFSEEMKKRGMATIKDFDPEIFETCIQKIIVGGYSEDGNPDPYLLTFLFKKGWKQVLKGSQSQKAVKVYQETLKYREVLRFSHFWRHNVFVETKKNRREKRIEDFITIVVAVQDD